MHARALLLLPLLLPLLLSSACPPEAGDDDDGPPPVVASLGGISIRQAVGLYQITAFFHEDAPATGCTDEDVAGCTVTTCTGGADPIAFTSLDAGAVTVATPRLEHTLTLAGDGAYGAVSVTDSEFFLNAEELTGTLAGGADVAATTFTLDAPTRIQLTAPPLQAVNVRVTNPIDIAWSNASAGDVKATLTDAAFTLFASCTASAAGASLTIPAEVVGRFPVGSGRLDLEVTAVTSKELDATHSVFFAATSTVTSPTGGLGQYNVFFEAP